MATTTENLGLTLPAGTEKADISVLNENFQAIDTFAGQATADIQQAQETANAAAPQSTTYTKTEVDTALAAKLNTSDVDASLSSTSENPVQNKVVQASITQLGEEVEEIENIMQIPSFDTNVFSSLSAYSDTMSAGTYTFFVPSNNTLTDVPMNDSNAIVTARVYNTNVAVLDFTAISTTYQMYRYSRIKSSGTWHDWYRFEGTAVT